MARDSSATSAKALGGAGISLRIPSPFVIAFLGMGFSLIFQRLFFVHTDPNPVLLGNQVTLPYHIASIAAFLACAIASRRDGFTLARSRIALIASMAACMAGVLVVALSTLLSDAMDTAASTVLFTLGSIVVASANAVLLLAWFETIARLSMDYALLYYVSASLAGSLVGYLAGFIGSGITIYLVLIMLPACSVGCLALCLRKLDTLPYAHGETPKSLWAVPWKPVILLAVFYFAAKFTLNVLSPDLRANNSAGSTIANIIILAVVVFGFQRFRLQIIRVSSLPLLIAGILCAMIASSFGAAGMVIPSTIITGIARNVFYVFVVAMLCDFCYRRGVNALWVFGLTSACSGVGTLMANLVSLALSGQLASPLYEQAALSIVIVVATVAFLALSSDADEKDAWGLTAAHNDAAPLANPQARLAQQCGQAARVYNLTRREEEILRMRLGGATLKEVEDQLVIAHNTVKSHVRHIYAKLEVSDLEEARVKVEGL